MTNKNGWGTRGPAAGRSSHNPQACRGRGGSGHCHLLSVVAVVGESCLAGDMALVQTKVAKLEEIRKLSALSILSCFLIAFSPWRQASPGTEQVKDKWKVDKKVKMKY